MLSPGSTSTVCFVSKAGGGVTAQLRARYFLRVVLLAFLPEKLAQLHLHGELKRNKSRDNVHVINHSVNAVINTHKYY